MKENVNCYIIKNFPLALRKMSLYGSRFERLRNTGKVNCFGLINSLLLRDTELIEPQIDAIKELLSHVENIQIDCTTTKCDFHEGFLRYCSRMKHLMLRGSSCTIIGNGNTWLHRQYPTLEHFGVDDRFYNQPELKCIDLRDFFELNPNIRIFSSTIDYFWQNREWILGSNIRIDRLDIWNNFRSDIGIGHVCDLLNELHDQGFHQRLTFYLFKCDPEDLSDISRLRALEGLALPHFGANSFDLPLLTNLKELSLYNFPVRNLEGLPNNLPNVQRICICGPYLDMILPFVHRCPTLKQIKVRPLWYGAFGNPEGTDTINLQALNNQRKKLTNAQKITIFVNEEIYLTYKWKQETNFSLVELERDLAWKQSNPFYNT